MTQKVLFTASTFSHLQRFHRPYLRAFRELGWTVHAACGGAEAAGLEADAVFALPFVKRLSAPANFRAAGRLRAILAENRYDLVCAHTSLASFFTRFAAAQVFPHPPVVNVVHGYLFADPPAGPRDVLLALAEKLAAPRTEVVAAMNESDFRTAQARRLGRRIVKIPGMGVDFSRQDGADPAEAEELRRRLRRGEDDFLLLCPAEFSRRKNQAELISALPLLPPRVRLVLPGEGEELAACRRLAERMGASDRVLFPGWADDTAVWYAAADAAVSASRCEGLPFAVMEAMYAGLPVVASRIKGHVDLLEDGRTGLLYPGGESAALARQVRRLLEEPELGARLGAAAKAACTPYALERVEGPIMELYLSAADRGTDGKEERVCRS